MVAVFLASSTLGASDASVVVERGCVLTVSWLAVKSRVSAGFPFLNPPRKQGKSGSICGMICGPKWIPQMVQRSLNKQTSLTQDRSLLICSSLLIPLNGSHNPCKQLDSKCKTSISEKYPFPFRGPLVHQQSLAKQPQHHPKSHLKRDPKKIK